MTEYLDVEDLLGLAGQLGVAARDVGLLESAAARPQTSLFGDDAYPGLFEKAAALLHSLVRNHALVDGNKRIGWTAATVFLRINGQNLDAEDDPAYDLVIAIAEGRLDVPEIAAALEGWSRPVG